MKKNSDDYTISVYVAYHFYNKKSTKMDSNL